MTSTLKLVFVLLALTSPIVRGQDVGDAAVDVLAAGNETPAVSNDTPPVVYNAVPDVAPVLEATDAQPDVIGVDPVETPASVASDAAPVASDVTLAVVSSDYDNSQRFDSKEINDKKNPTNAKGKDVGDAAVDVLAADNEIPAVSNDPPPVVYNAVPDASLVLEASSDNAPASVPEVIPTVVSVATEALATELTPVVSSDAAPVVVSSDAAPVVVSSDAAPVVVSSDAAPVVVSSDATSASAAEATLAVVTDSTPAVVTTAAPAPVTEATAVAVTEAASVQSDSASISVVTSSVVTQPQPETTQVQSLPPVPSGGPTKGPDSHSSQQFGSFSDSQGSHSKEINGKKFKNRRLVFRQEKVYKIPGDGLNRKAKIIQKINNVYFRN